MNWFFTVGLLSVASLTFWHGQKPRRRACLEAGGMTCQGWGHPSAMLRRYTRGEWTFSPGDSRCAARLWICHEDADGVFFSVLLIRYVGI